MKEKMNVKRTLVSFLAIATLLLLAVSVSAAGDIATSYEVKIDGESASDISVIAGQTIDVKVIFTAETDNTDTTDVETTASNVRVKAVIEGEKQDVEERTAYFDIEDGKVYSKTLSLEVPFDLKNELSDDLSLNIKIWNSDLSTELTSIVLRVQRPSYNAEILAVNTEDSVKAGEVFPVEVVLKNKGYNDLDDLYVTAKITALDVEKTAYFGDLVSQETDDEDEDETDTVSGKLYLRVPYDAESGKYLVEVEVSNEDTVSTQTVEITVDNEFPEEVMKLEKGLLIVNPTTDLKIYKVLTPAGEEIVTVQAGSSETINVEATTGDYVVTVLTMNGELLGSFTFKVSEQPAASNPITVLTIILGIVFLVLLVVLIVLMSKKPQKSEELGESYY